MTHPEVGEARSVSVRDLVRALAAAAVIVIATLVLNVVLGVQNAGPSYDIVPDPASLSGLPF